ncbi:hypothetical protein SDRG_15064 [Saprolegnia diclina VS20]|uniref:Uncharacterized protein n=1 Tax=Saprolegnia diclina (strain VS20) TaxID=1156394 RepID=T0RC42_SAPDV|nr:hypothetical protein SDRG_15064 [Saprolegnia diclina VS20]EQC27162.1 hypothetical protein SDRG_15064 [Saprolegnia diclina VS20]|eukprot:XP_008619448.1 hypothetical protein SDRG_15064 [Saprolegnia diclina VS20]
MPARWVWRRQRLLVAPCLPEREPSDKSSIAEDLDDVGASSFAHQMVPPQRSTVGDSAAHDAGVDRKTNLFLTCMELRTPDFMNALVVATRQDRPAILERLTVNTPSLIPALGDAEEANSLQPSSLLHYAAESSAHAVMPWLLTQSVPVGSRNHRGETPLHAASRVGNVRGLAMLLRAGADVHATNDNGDSALHIVLKSLHEGGGRAQVLERLLILNVALDAENMVGQRPADLTDDPTTLERLAKEADFRVQFPLHRIARANDVSGFDAWLTDTLACATLDSGARIERAISCIDMDGKTVVLHAIEALDPYATDQVLARLMPYCTLECLLLQDKTGRSAEEYLLEKDVMCKGDVTNAALIAAVDAVCRKTKRALNFGHNIKRLQYGTPPLVCCGACTGVRQSAHSTSTLAQLAADEKWIELEGRLEAGTNVDDLNDYDTKGYTVLHHCCAKRNLPNLKLLLKLPGLHIDCTTRDGGKTALAMAEAQNEDDYVERLLQAGAHHGFLEPFSAKRVLEIHKRGSECEYLRCNCWEMAARYPAFYLARVLSVDDMKKHLQYNDTPLHVAARKSLPIAVFKTLLARDDIDVDGVTTEDETALMIVAGNGKLEHVELLLNHGANIDLADFRHRTAIVRAGRKGHRAVVERLLELFADMPAVKGHRAYFGDEIHTLLEKELVLRDNSPAYREHLAQRLVTKTTYEVFSKHGFSEAIACSPAIATAFLDDCICMSRHDATFTNLDLVYGLDCRSSALYTVLNLNLKDPDEMFAAQKACLEHVVFRRLLEIKWELFGRRMYVERLLMHILLLVTMTISSILFGDVPPSSTSFGIGLTTALLAVVGLVAAQGLRPRRFARLRAKMPSDRHVRWCLVGWTIAVTATLTALFVHFADELHIDAWFARFNNAVLAATTVYFIVNEVYEIKAVGRIKYISSSMNVVQLVAYGLILGVFVAMKLGWLPASTQVQVGFGALLALVLWVFSLQFLEVVSSASYLLPMMAHLFGDIWNFFLIFGIFQIGLTLIFYQLFVLKPDAAFSSLGQSFMSTYFVTFGQVPLSSLDTFTNTADVSGSYDTLYIGTAILMMAHSAIMVVVLLNVLLAMMNQTVEGSLANAKAQALISYAQSILRLEGAMNLSEKETMELMHLVDDRGKRILHPIFTTSVPKASLGIVPEQADALMQNTSHRVSWIEHMDALDKVVESQMAFVRNSLEHVGHFTDLDVSAVFGGELNVLASKQKTVKEAIELARRSRGQFKEHVLGNLNDRVSKQLRLCKAQIANLWRRIDETEPLSDHDQCMLLFQLNQRVAIDVHLTTMTDAMTRAIADVAKVELSTPGDDDAEATSARFAYTPTAPDPLTNEVARLQQELSTLKETTEKEIAELTTREEMKVAAVAVAKDKEMAELRAENKAIAAKLDTILALLARNTPTTNVLDP